MPAVCEQSIHEIFPTLPLTPYLSVSFAIVKTNSAFKTRFPRGVNIAAIFTPISGSCWTYYFSRIQSRRLTLLKSPRDRVQKLDRRFSSSVTHRGRLKAARESFLPSPFAPSLCFFLSLSLSLPRQRPL